MSPNQIFLLEKCLLDRRIEVEHWFERQWQNNHPPFYASVDLRNAGFKLSPVDTNLFPSGFNNLDPTRLPFWGGLARSYVKDTVPSCMRILLISESHTRNLFYYESLTVIRDLLLAGGFEVRIASLDTSIITPQSVVLPSGKTVNLEPLQRKNNRLELKDFSPCAILLNNDLSSGIPELLEGLEQPVLPHPMLGWAHRLKSDHFAHYDSVAREFANFIGVDPWLISPNFRSCKDVDFLKGEGEACLFEHTTSLLREIQDKYDFYGIQYKPYVVIKAEAGTYGMGVLIVHSADEIINMNRKKRTKMAVIKGRRTIRQVILQEGVYTFEKVHEITAEPVVYLLGTSTIGGFYRTQRHLGNTDNLNAPGAHFVPFTALDSTKDLTPTDPHYTCPYYAYDVVARLALLAAAREQAELVSNPLTAC